jgi:hypothetical protein
MKMKTVMVRIVSGRMKIGDERRKTLKCVMKIGNEDWKLHVFISLHLKKSFQRIIFPMVKIL